MRWVSSSLFSCSLLVRNTMPYCVLGDICWFFVWCDFFSPFCSKTQHASSMCIILLAPLQHFFFLYITTNILCLFLLTHIWSEHGGHRQCQWSQYVCCCCRLLSPPSCVPPKIKERKKKFQKKKPQRKVHIFHFIIFESMFFFQICFFSLRKITLKIYLSMAIKHHS